MSDAEPVAFQIVRSLRDDILNGVLAPGLQIRQEVVAEQFGVSRVPVREALRQLEAEGLVTTELHKGAFVSTRSLDEVEEMLDIRIALELRALKLAIPNLTRESLGKAGGILETYDRCDDPRQWRDLNLAFHLALYEPCNRPRLVKMIEDVQLANSHFLRTYVSITVGREGAQAEHHEILAACAARDSRRALRLLETHIEHTRLALQRRRVATPSPATSRASRR
ncbi:MAG: GntR family transcriptional regulator [Burkholderiales bacterium]